LGVVGWLASGWERELDRLGTRLKLLLLVFFEQVDHLLVRV
jgi:hypothetical protein